MYISSIHIKNYRSFSSHEILFSPGLNILIGHNNAGKTNVLKALHLIFERKKRNRPSIEDFNSQFTDFSFPPTIQISVTIQEHEDESEDKNVVFDWLIQEEKPYMARLTYLFALPVKHLNDYTSEIQTYKKPDGTYQTNECFKLIEKKYLPKYVANIYGGDLSKQEKADEELLSRFDFQFLDAIRDPESHLYYKNGSILREVLNYFLDYELTEGKDFEQLEPSQKRELFQREKEFNQKSNSLLQHLIDRISKDQIKAYSQATGAQKGGVPDFDAHMSELEIMSALRLIIKKHGLNLPLTNNGLGYNNLLYISLILAKMQMERSSFMGDNAKIFPILAIEEPEAHLHPSMQYKFLKFLNQNLHDQKQARQAFITTHSTQITAAVDLDSIICLYEDCERNQRVAYPAKAFPLTPEGKDSKIFVKRFLDATKSNMLFADKVILVEGLAEQLLLPCFAAYLDKEETLIDDHVSIVSVDSRTFKHFLQLFAFDARTNPVALYRKVVCVTDADPLKRRKALPGNDRAYWKSCYPCELNINNTQFDYQELASHAISLKEFADLFLNIHVCTPIAGKGKTLEYELAYYNPSCQLLLTESLPSRGKNTRDAFEILMSEYKKGTSSINDLLALSENEPLKTIIQMSKWDEDQKKRAFIASLYHQVLEDSKGEHAFLLEKQLRENLSLQGAKICFIIPPYIQEAIQFITQ
ncbi:AAA family ATPase [Rhodocytophaga aerolata]|uniref:AAA family ATPase n=1 Tax=Rhodocytophaga aerolata TaxID=455078 RepID=A0ABT8QXT0_9BACT|nr:AAA family ATPase [Rhodocytophaga aerolata]MDO1444647.1 AAA family ATPase [Rhodocytophaga aerolata]